MIEFTVELEGTTLTVMADRAYIIDGSLNFYNIRSVGSVVCPSDVKDIVGSFSDYKCFYIKGDSDE